MSDGAPNPEVVFDPALATPGAAQPDPSPAETPGTEPDRVVASLRAEFRGSLEEKAKSESRLRSFFSRRRRSDSAVGVQTTLAPREPAFISPVMGEFSAGYAEAEPLTTEEPEPQEPVEEASFVSAPPPRESAESSWPEEMQADGPSEPAPVEPEFAASAEVVEEEVIAAAPAAGAGAVSEQAIEYGAEPASAKEAQPSALQGEVLPPERSPDRARTSDPARVITMQPGVPRSGSEEPPASASE